MSKKIEITEKQLHQFNQMYWTLKRISDYQTPKQLRRSCEKDYGIDYEEGLEMAYENAVNEAKVFLKKMKVKPIKP